MKKTLLLMLFILLFISCRKEPGIQQLWFSPSYVNGTESVKFDSIAFTTIIYSDLAVLADSQTIDLDVKTEYLSLKSNHTYAFKKFEMVGKSGKVMYYIPLRADTASERFYMQLLPLFFRIPEEGASLAVRVIRYPY